MAKVKKPKLRSGNPVAKIRQFKQFKPKILRSKKKDVRPLNLELDDLY